MHVGDRARFLVSRGIDPVAEADLSVSARIHAKVLARRLRRARAGAFALGCCATILVGSALHVRPVAPHETTALSALARAGVDADHPLPDDLPIRLAVPRADVAAVAAVLSPSAQVEPDMSWVATLDGHPGVPTVTPSRLGALHGVVAYLALLAPETWPNVLTDFRVVIGLSDAARDLLGALHPVPTSELHYLPRLIQAYMTLSPDRRQALEQAGFPPVPTDPTRQQLYVLIGRADADQGTAISRILQDHRLQRALPRVEALLQSRDARRLLGVLADRVYGVPDFPDVPQSCDIASPGSCRRAQ